MTDTEARTSCEEIEPGVYLARLNAILPAELVDDFLSKLFYVSALLTDFELTTARDAVSFRLPENSEPAPEIIAGSIIEVAERMLRAFRPQETRILVSRRHETRFADDPHPLLESSGDLIRFGPGRFGFGPRVVGLLDFFDRRTTQLAQTFAAEPYQFPTLIGAEVLERCKYLRSFPHSLSLVAHLNEDLRAIQNFARTARWDGTKLVCDEQDPTVIKCLLSPTICFHCYAWLQNSCLPAPRSFTAAGKCFRYESGNLGGLERLWDFTMREIIFLGPAEYVLSQREKAINESIKLLDEWQLSFEIISATDPFFVDEYSMTSFQAAFDLKYEIQAPLPYRKKGVAVGSFNFHQDMFGRSLNISGADLQAVNTGCVGFGLERLVLAFLAQHGLNAKHWPEAVASKVTGW
jgi:hypothetical protein